MNENLEVGQILWLKVKYQVDIISNQKHPMLIEKIKDDYIEVIALDKTKDKLYQLFHNYNYYINCESPKEKVILEDSYAQLNTKLTIENADKQYISAVFQMYSSKENRDAGLKPFSDIMTVNFELEKEFEGNIREKIYEVAKSQIAIFAEAEVI